ncbi:MAG: sugar phosphate isomerase/epimerase family protein [Burkholderiales bacterium]
MPAWSLCPLAVLDVDPPHLIALAAKAGYAAVGIRMVPASPGGIEYPLRAGSAEIRETLHRMNDLGVRVFDLEFLSLSPEFDARQFRWLAEAGAALGARRINCSGDDPDPLRAADHFAALCDLAAEYRLGVDIEFMRWRHTSTLDHAVELVRRAGKANGGILLDALHLIRAGGSPTELAKVPREFLVSAQLCDAPAASPPDSRLVAESRTNRLVPGEGELPLRQIVEALPNDIALALEVPMSAYAPDAPPIDRATRAIVAAEKLLASWRAVGN